MRRRIKCDERLQRYFDGKYGAYSKNAKWLEVHSPNERKIFIPAIQKLITLICSPSSGVVEERVQRCADPDLIVGPNYAFVDKKRWDYKLKYSISIDKKNESKENKYDTE